MQKSSTCNWKFLSPKSAKKRVRNLTADARRLTKEVERLRKKLDVSLSPELSGEMRQITSKISSQYHECLDDIFEEAEKKTKGKGGLMKEMWKQDVDDRKAFWKDQCRNGRRQNFDFSCKCEILKIYLYENHGILLLGTNCFIIFSFISSYIFT